MIEDSTSIPVSSGTDIMKLSDVPSLEYSETPKFKGKAKKSRIKDEVKKIQSIPLRKGNEDLLFVVGISAFCKYKSWFYSDYF